MADTDPITPLREAATAMHEVFNEFRAAGFTESQALAIVSGMMTRAVDG